MAVLGGVTVGLMALVLFYASRIEPDWLQVQPIEAPISGLPAAFDGYLIVQISDIHLNEWMTPERLERIVHRINELQPDLVAITGDFVSPHQADLISQLPPVLKQIKPRDAVVAVLGNHDHWNNLNAIRDALKASGVLELNNGVYTVRRGEDILHVAGLDDVWAKKRDLPRLLRSLSDEHPAILLAHEPDIANTVAQTGRFALQLSGHTHGGQIRIPFLGPLRLPLYGRRYHTGLYRIGQMLLYTNRGVGMSKPYLRFACRPEITVFTLRQAPSIV